MSSALKSGGITPVVTLPRSKSHANRFLVLAARHGEGAIVRQLPGGDDVRRMLAALQAVGVGLRVEGDDVFFLTSFPACEPTDGKPLVLDVGEGGTTARFLCALLARGSRRYHLRLSGRLAERPWEELLEALRAAGADAHLENGWVNIQGPVSLPLLPKKISAARSTQFASALQLAFAHDGVDIGASSVTSSRPYWELTRHCVEEMRRQADVTVPLDWSAAAYPLCFAAVTGHPVTLAGLTPDSQQADAVLLGWLQERGAVRVDGLGVHGERLRGRSPLDVAVEHCLDLVPALAFLAAHLEGPSLLRGVGGLIHKESDRLAAVMALLAACGVPHRLDEDTLEVRGPMAPLPPTHLYPPPDHRMVMTAALFLRAHGGGVVENPGAVAKSFPGFFRLFP